MKNNLPIIMLLCLKILTVNCLSNCSSQSDCKKGYICFENSCSDLEEFYQKIHILNTKLIEESSTRFLDLLYSNNMNVVTAESLTAGMISSSLVNIPGYGGNIYGGFAVYDTRAKRKFLNVIAKDVYTPECAIQMAEGALKFSEANMSISVTGNAGPVAKKDIHKLGVVDIGISIKVPNNDATEDKFYTKTKRIRICENRNFDILCKKYRAEAMKDPRGYVSKQLLALIRMSIREKTVIEALNFATKQFQNFDL